MSKDLQLTHNKMISFLNLIYFNTYVKTKCTQT